MLRTRRPVGCSTLGQGVHWIAAPLIAGVITRLGRQMGTPSPPNVPTEALQHPAGMGKRPYRRRRGVLRPRVAVPSTTGTTDLRLVQLGVVV
jgi:hypothetical protein